MSSYKAVKVQINGVPFEDGISVPMYGTNVTFIKYTVLNLLHTPWKQLGFAHLNVNGHDVIGIAPEGKDTYIPWNFIADNVKPVFLADGINFVTSIATPTPGNGTLVSGETVVAEIPFVIIWGGICLDTPSFRPAQLDTGAEITTIGGAWADVMKQAGINLPNLGTETVVGVTGKEDAYTTKFDFHLTDTFTIKDCDAIVVKDFNSYPLVGWDIFEKNGYDLLVSHPLGKVFVLKKTA